MFSSTLCVFVCVVSRVYVQYIHSSINSGTSISGVVLNVIAIRASVRSIIRIISIISMLTKQ